jgi:hypothetical protein
MGQVLDLPSRRQAAQSAKNGKVVPPRRRPNQTLRTRECLTPEEVDRLLAAAGGAGRYGNRDRTLLLVMLAAWPAGQRGGGPALGTGRPQGRSSPRPAPEARCEQVDCGALLAAPQERIGGYMVRKVTGFNIAGTSLSCCLT